MGLRKIERTNMIINPTPSTLSTARGVGFSLIVALENNVMTEKGWVSNYRQRQKCNRMIYHGQLKNVEFVSLVQKENKRDKKKTFIKQGSLLENLYILKKVTNRRAEERVRGKVRVCSFLLVKR